MRKLNSSLEETCVHLDGDRSLVYTVHMVPTFFLLLQALHFSKDDKTTDILSSNDFR